MEYQQIESCPDCHGSGAAAGTSPKTCPNCGGTGQVRISQRTPFGMVQSTQTCDRCHGTGKIIDTPCKTCDGKGRIRRHKSVEVTVPAGIDDEQILNVGGRGNAGLNGGPAGDLHVYISVRPHPIFERRGVDVWCEMPLTFTQAALGADVEVPTLDGKVSYHVHEGTQPGDVFRLKGRGIQSLQGRGAGGPVRPGDGGGPQEPEQAPERAALRAGPGQRREELPEAPELFLQAEGPVRGIMPKNPKKFHRFLLPKGQERWYNDRKEAFPPRGDPCGLFLSWVRPSPRPRKGTCGKCLSEEGISCLSPRKNGEGVSFAGGSPPLPGIGEPPCRGWGTVPREFENSLPSKGDLRKVPLRGKGSRPPPEKNGEGPVP